MVCDYTSIKLLKFKSDACVGVGWEGVTAVFENAPE